MIFVQLSIALYNFCTSHSSTLIGFGKVGKGGEEISRMNKHRRISFVAVCVGRGWGAQRVRAEGANEGGTAVGGQVEGEKGQCVGQITDGFP